MKAIMISIQPKWVAKILNGEKTIEIRKTMPKCELPIDVYIYCTKTEPYLTRGNNGNTYESCCISNGLQEWHLNGKVVAKFTLKKVEEITWCFDKNSTIFREAFTNFDLLKRACLTEEQFENYYSAKGTYAWHIEDLLVFLKPKELGEFYTTHLDKTIPEIFDNSIQLPNGVWVKQLTKAPQSWGYIEVWH